MLAEENRNFVHYSDHYWYFDRQSDLLKYFLAELTTTWK